MAQSTGCRSVSVGPIVPDWQELLQAWLLHERCLVKEKSSCVGHWGDVVQQNLYPKRAARNRQEATTNSIQPAM
jgi:hypothetical protein